MTTINVTSIGRIRGEKERGESGLCHNTYVYQRVPPRPLKPASLLPPPSLDLPTNTAEPLCSVIENTWID